MSKPKSKRRLQDNEAQAVSRLMRVSPQKLNLVAGLIRGKKASSAVANLTFSQKRIAGQVLKTLQSAIANAENNHSLDIDSLVVAQAHVGRAMTMGRFHARGRGKAAAIERPFSHLTIVVRQVDEESARAPVEKPGKADKKNKMDKTGKSKTSKKRAA
jgi:large subunit ribosomal protein L22